jgi:hypothetical protein
VAEDTVRIYYDTEFLEDGNTIRLISIGMIREDGTGIYQVVKDYELLKDVYQHDWLRKNVFTSLPATVGTDGLPYWDELHKDYDKRTVTDRKTIADNIKRFVLDTPNPELWAYYSAYDHVALCQLYGRMIDLPTGFPMYTNDLKSEIVRLGNPRVPEQAEGAHNAFMDAWWNKETYEYLQSLRRAL